MQAVPPRVRIEGDGRPGLIIPDSTLTHRPATSDDASDTAPPEVARMYIARDLSQKARQRAGLQKR